MKTTVEIPNELLHDAKVLAAREGTTLRAFLVEGLRLVLSQRRAASGFQLRAASVPGNGVQAGVTEGQWEPIRDLTYRGRGS